MSLYKLVIIAWVTTGADGGTHIAVHELEPTLSKDVCEIAAMQATNPKEIDQASNMERRVWGLRQIEAYCVGVKE